MTEHLVATLTLKKWTPKAAHRAAIERVARIRRALEEIVSLYGDIDMPVVAECEDRIDALNSLTAVLDTALAEGSSP